MPVQKGKSGLYAKMGDTLKKAHEAHKADETTYSEFGELPEGIENGIAQLVDIKFDQVKAGKDNAGEYYFYAAGTVHIPVDVETKNGKVHVEGLRTSITEPLYPTPTRSRKTVDDHLAWIYNELRKLGIDTTQMQFEDLEGTVAALKEAAPFFKFRTWKGEATKDYPNPRVNHQWNGVVDFTPDEGGPAVVEGSSGTPTQTSTTLSPPTDIPPKPPTKAATAPKQPEEPDVNALAVAADNASDEAAMNKLSELAAEAGIPDDQVANAANWAAIAAMIEAAKKGGATATASATTTGAEWKPEVGEVYLYKPVNPKTKKPAEKGVECEVATVEEAEQTVSLKNLDNPKVVYKKVKWDSLEGAA